MFQVLEEASSSSSPNIITISPSVSGRFGAAGAKYPWCSSLVAAWILIERKLDRFAVWWAAAGCPTFLNQRSADFRKARLTSAQRHAKRSAEYWERNGALEYAKDSWTCWTKLRDLLATLLPLNYLICSQAVHSSQAATRRTAIVGIVLKKLNEFGHDMPWLSTLFNIFPQSCHSAQPQDFISSHVCSTQPPSHRGAVACVACVDDCVTWHEASGSTALPTLLCSRGTAVTTHPLFLRLSMSLHEKHDVTWFQLLIWCGPVDPIGEVNKLYCIPLDSYNIPVIFLYSYDLPMILLLYPYVCFPMFLLFVLLLPSPYPMSTSLGGPSFGIHRKKALGPGEKCPRQQWPTKISQIQWYSSGINYDL